MHITYGYASQPARAVRCAVEGITVPYATALIDRCTWDRKCSEAHRLDGSNIYSKC